MKSNGPRIDPWGAPCLVGCTAQQCFNLSSSHILYHKSCSNLYSEMIFSCILHVLCSYLPLFPFWFWLYLLLFLNWHFEQMWCITEKKIWNYQYINDDRWTSSMEAQNKICCTMQSYVGTVKPCWANLGQYMCHNIQYYGFWVLPVKGTAVEMYPEEVMLPSWPVVFYFSHSFDTAPNLNNSEVVRVHVMRT